MIALQGPEISVNSEDSVMIYKKYFDKEEVIMKVLCFIYVFILNESFCRFKEPRKILN